MPPPTTDTNDERTGTAAAIAAAVIFGIAYPATAVALRSFSPLAIAGLSSTLALVVIGGLAIARVLPAPQLGEMTRPRLVRLVVLALLGGILFITGVNIAVAIAGPTITGFVAPLYALFATLLAVPLLGERLRPTTVVAFGLAIVGTGLLAEAFPTGAPLGGIALGLVAAAMFGAYVVLARRWGGPYRLDGTLVTMANLAGRGPVLLAVAVALQPGTVFPSVPDAAAVVALVAIAFSSSAGNLLLVASVRRIPAGRASAALLLTPVSSAVIAAVVLGERLTPVGLAGAAFILVGMAVGSGLLGRPRRTPSPR